MKKNLEKIPEEFKQLAKDFSDNGFITTSFDRNIIPSLVHPFSIHK